MSKRARKRNPSDDLWRRFFDAARGSACAEDFHASLGIPHPSDPLFDIDEFETGFPNTEQLRRIVEEYLALCDSMATLVHENDATTRMALREGVRRFDRAGNLLAKCAASRSTDPVPFTRVKHALSQSSLDEAKAAAEALHAIAEAEEQRERTIEAEVEQLACELGRRRLPIVRAIGRGELSKGEIARAVGQSADGGSLRKLLADMTRDGVLFHPDNRKPYRVAEKYLPLCDG